jgi:dTDP-4-dehydrorhamnose 3,5-epimerase
MKTIQSKLKNCYLMQTDICKDDRGLFNKTYHQEMFKKEGVDIDIKEQFYTVSSKNVLRGMHFQLPPYHHDKLVSCLSGSIMDVVLDLRKTSKTYKQFDVFELKENDGQIIYIPSGVAHGFLSLEDNSGVLYNVSKVYHPKFDCGISWDSFNFDWKCSNPIISERDQKHMALSQFKTPF